MSDLIETALRRHAPQDLPSARQLAELPPAEDPDADKAPQVFPSLAETLWEAYQREIGIASQPNEAQPATTEEQSA